MQYNWQTCFHGNGWQDILAAAKAHDLMEGTDQMKLVKCPRCDLNYIREDEKLLQGMPSRDEGRA